MFDSNKTNKFIMIKINTLFCKTEKNNQKKIFSGTCNCSEWCDIHWRLQQDSPTLTGSFTFRDSFGN